MGLHVLQAIAACLGAMIFIMPLLYPDVEVLEYQGGPTLPQNYKR